MFQRGTGLEKGCLEAETYSSYASYFVCSGFPMILDNTKLLFLQKLSHKHLYSPHKNMKQQLSW